MSTTEDLATELVEIATTAAIQAGALLAEMAPRRLDLRAMASAKSSITDLVTAADIDSEAAVLEIVLGARPDDAIMAEEGSSRPGTSSVTWVIDPLDGTTNFVYGYGEFAVSIAAKVDDVVVAGVVHNPIAKETFAATLGGGATRNGQAMTPSDPSSLASSLVGTGFGYLSEARADQARILPYLVPAIRDIRRGGCASLDCCGVGAGRLDGYFEAGLKPWDFAAGLLVATEAGCGSRSLENFPGRSTTLVIASSDILDSLVNLLIECDAKGRLEGH
ncbi:MAG TPA: inositol monophosphatase family protein [Acidimicrobiales bacterium]